MQLANAGAVRGGRIAFIGSNSSQLIAGLFATWRSGLIAVPLNWRQTAEELANVIGDCLPSVVVIDPDLIELVREATSQLHPMPNLVPSHCTTQISDGVLSVGWEPGEEDTALLLYKAGTTGNPNGVMLAHRSLAKARSTGQRFGMGPLGVVLAALPQSLAYGLTDSPAGLAGWILEKFRAWSDCGGLASPQGRAPLRHRVLERAAQRRTLRSDGSTRRIRGRCSRSLQVAAVAWRPDRKGFRLKVRAPDFDFSDMNPHWARNPEAAQSINASHLVPPYIEPFLIKVMQRAKGELDPERDAQLIADIDILNKQEGQHNKVHGAYLRMLRDNGYDEMAEIEAAYAADYKHFLARKSLRFFAPVFRRV